MRRPLRCLLVESLSYHWEVLPAWIRLLERLGCEVELAGCDGSSGFRETVAMLGGRCRIRRLSDLQELDAAGVDFILLNSLVHEGYAFASPPVPRPNLQWLRETMLPSIAVVHEPVHWVEKRVVRAFREEAPGSRPGGHRLLKLLGDGYIQYDGGNWSEERWQFDDRRLTLVNDGVERVFEGDERGQTWHGIGDDGGTALERVALPVEDLAGHCADGRHAIVTLSCSGAAHLAPVCRGVDWILPFERREPLPARATGDIAFAGVIDYDRKQIPALMRGCEALRDGQSILMIGGSRTDDFENDRIVRRFRDDLAERGLADRFRFTGYLPYDAFVERIRGCRFLLPLVDDHVDAGSYLTKLPAAVASSLGCGVPLIVNELIAERFDLDYMIRYRDDDLASGLAAERSMQPAAYDAMLRALDRHAEALDRHNLEVLAGLIERIVDGDPAITDRDGG